MYACTVVVEFENSRFQGTESSQSVQTVISKSDALSDPLYNASITVQITLTEHGDPSMSAKGRHITEVSKLNR